jgi:hypothetical protein
VECEVLSISKFAVQDWEFVVEDDLEIGGRLKKIDMLFGGLAKIRESPAWQENIHSGSMPAIF